MICPVGAMTLAGPAAVAGLGRMRKVSARKTLARLIADFRLDGAADLLAGLASSDEHRDVRLAAVSAARCLVPDPVAERLI